MEISPALAKKNVLPVAIIGFMVLASTFVIIQVSAGLPASKHAVAGEDTVVIGYEYDLSGPIPQIYANIPVLSTWIKTSEQKDLVISFTTECTLLTDTKIKGGALDVNDYDEAMDSASIVVWATVDEEVVFPGKVCFAERVQMLKGLLGWVTYNVNVTTGEVTGEIPEELELLLKTTSANGFNYLALNVGSGEHEVKIWATIELWDVGDWREEEMRRVAAAIGKRTLVVQEVRLVGSIDDVEPGV